MTSFLQICSRLLFAMNARKLGLFYARFVLLSRVIAIFQSATLEIY